jgi:hypothetical protein
MLRMSRSTSAWFFPVSSEISRLVMLSCAEVTFWIAFMISVIPGSVFFRGHQVGIKRPQQGTGGQQQNKQAAEPTDDGKGGLNDIHAATCNHDWFERVAYSRIQMSRASELAGYGHTDGGRSSAKASAARALMSAMGMICSGMAICSADPR